MHRMVFALAMALLAVWVRAAEVKAIRTPDGGIQPQAAVDQRGTLHLIYFKGDPAAGNIFYVRKEPGEAGFSRPVRVNTRPGTAIAVGSIRGAQLALGKNGRVHVVWDGMGKEAEKTKADGKERAPLLYTRLNDAGTAFEPERNVITYAWGLDGGSSVAADENGNVDVVWHGRTADAPEGEAGRAVYVAHSADEGRTFAREKPALTKNTGACACCGLRAFADAKGGVYILYRAATESMNRGETLLVSPSPGAEFKEVFYHPWKAMMCPMSSASFSQDGTEILPAWETGDRVYFARLDSRTLKMAAPVSPAGDTKRKHPVAVANGRGETLFAWTEGTAWAKGGSVAWQLFDDSNKPVSEVETKAGLAPWSLVTACAEPNGRFLVIY